MVIPDNIEGLISRRAFLASQLMSVDYELSEWLTANEIPVESKDYLTGFEVYLNPHQSAERVREAIRNK